MTYRCLLVFIVLGLGPALAPAATDWWPFGKDWGQEPIEVQDRKAAPIIDSAIAAEENGEKGRAIALYEDVWDGYPGSSYAGPALYRYGKLNLEKDNYRKAFEAYDRIIRFYPEFENFNLVIADQYEIASALANEKTSRFIGLIPFRDYEKAVAYFENIAAAAPYSEYAPLALMNVAKIHLNRGDRLQGIDALDRLVNNYPESNLAPDAYLAIANTYASMVDGPEYDQESTREALNYYRDFMILYPESALVIEGEEGLAKIADTYARSRYSIGRYYYKHRDNNTAAKVFLNEAITISPESPTADDARELLAKIEAEGEQTADTGPKRDVFDYLLFWRKPDADEEAVPLDGFASPVNENQATVAGIDAAAARERETFQPPSADEEEPLNPVRRVVSTVSPEGIRQRQEENAELVRSQQPGADGGAESAASENNEAEGEPQKKGLGKRIIDGIIFWK